jgi:hypothetical protein
MYCRPLGTQFLARHHEPADVSLGGIRIYRNEKVRVGELLKMEFFVPDSPPVACTGQVVWVDTLPRGGPARYDVGLKFVELDGAAMSLLASMLGPQEK